RYAGDDALDLEGAFDLQAVRRVVPEPVDLECRVEVTDDLMQVHGHTPQAYSTGVLDVASAVIGPGGGRSHVHRARGAGPLRLLCPRAAGDAGWIVTSSLGGGLVHGDDVTLEVRVDAGATAVLTTQASTKIYKGSSRQRTELRVAGDGAALVVPDPVVPYRDATFTQVTNIELASESTLVLSDVLTAGRV